MTAFYDMTVKADRVIKRIKRDVPLKNNPEDRFIFIKAVQARLVTLEKETLLHVMRKGRARG